MKNFLFHSKSASRLILCPTVSKVSNFCNDCTVLTDRGKNSMIKSVTLNFFGRSRFEERVLTSLRTRNIKLYCYYKGRVFAMRSIGPLPPSGMKESCAECTSSLELCDSSSEYNSDFSWFNEVRTCHRFLTCYHNMPPWEHPAHRRARRPALHPGV